ncbi:MAG TPA: penicillin-binding protein 2 [Ideonella sp.]|uniref:penicillin-binding protein 2 n=1 Tax=Ideonella sp. TaxID=1929293 RepID=UPI002E36F0B9|nr:penicillin-binding protein 2 [Ideonella sp.]HEX5687669.1 penicillin-binding protein 2 [Ideonella sp.]
MTELKDLARELDRFRLRILAAALFVLFGFGLLAARLVYLQVLRHDELAIQAEANRTAIVPIVPNRGRIVDRHGIVLANNYTAYTLEITPSKVDDLEATINALAELVEIRPSDRRRFKRQLEESKSFESLPIRNRLSETEMARFIAQRFRFPGVDIKARLFRNYPLGETGSHLIGYIGRINQTEKQAMEDWEEETQANYRGTEYIGKLGLEQAYESELHGRTGVEQIETSAGGRAVRRLDSKPSTPGNTLILSIDIKLQALVEQLYGDRRGALVAIDPRNGEVLAFVSKPTFDPNLFVDGIDQENWSALNENIDKPLLNRAIRGTYPPGSTFKPFMSIAALNSGKRSASTVVMDNLTYTFGGRTFGSPETDRPGPKDMRAAIVSSSNVYFYSLANEMGVDLIHDQLAPFGLGRKTGIDMDGELTGDLPSTDWKRRRFKKPEQQKWYAGETISLGIGQGYNNFTMLQMANAMAALSSGGLRFKPRLVHEVEDAITREKRSNSSQALEPIGLKPEHVAVIRDAMNGVTIAGTSARVFAGAGYQSGGKTGTAQAVGARANEKYSAARMAEHLRDHSLYIAFAPVDEPRVALAVIVENAGWGSGAAAPIARRVLDYLLMDQYPSEEDIALVREGKGAAPIGTPRKPADVPLPTGVGASVAMGLVATPDPAGGAASVPAPAPATGALRATASAGASAASGTPGGQVVSPPKAGAPPASMPASAARGAWPAPPRPTPASASASGGQP